MKVWTYIKCCLKSLTMIFTENYRMQFHTHFVISVMLCYVTRIIYLSSFICRMINKHPEWHSAREDTPRSNVTLKVYNTAGDEIEEAALGAYIQLRAHMTARGMYARGWHYCDVTMGSIASLITSLMNVYSNVHSGADQEKHKSSASLAFVWGIHRRPVNYSHKWPVTRKMFPFVDVIMVGCFHGWISGA